MTSIRRKTPKPKPKPPVSGSRRNAAVGSLRETQKRDGQRQMAGVYRKEGPGPTGSQRAKQGYEKPRKEGGASSIVFRPGAKDERAGMVRHGNALVRRDSFHPKVLKKGLSKPKSR